MEHRRRTRGRIRLGLLPQALLGASIVVELVLSSFVLRKVAREALMRKREERNKIGRRQKSTGWGERWIGGEEYAERIDRGDRKKSRWPREGVRGAVLVDHFVFKVDGQR